MAGSRKTRRREHVTKQEEKSRQRKTVMHGVICQIILWGFWISIYLNWMPDDKSYQLIRKAVLAAPILLYIAPLLFCVISDLIIDRTRNWAWYLVISLWSPWLLSILVGKERSVEEYVKIYPTTRLYSRDDGVTVRICTTEGLQLWAGFAEAIMKAYRSNKSWAGSFSSEHLRVTGHRCRINMKPGYSASFEYLLLDLAKLAKLMIKYYKGDGMKPEAYMQKLYTNMTSPPVGGNSTAVAQKRFLKFLGKHLAFKSPRQKKNFLADLFKVLRALGSGSAERAAIHRAVDKINTPTKDWRKVAGKDPLLRRTLWYHKYKPNNTICQYGPGPGELFRFIRNFLEHGGDADANGQPIIGSLEDIDCAGPDLLPSFAVKLSYQLVMLLDMGGQLDYAWEHLE